MMKRKYKAVVVCNGEPPSRTLLSRMTKDAQLVVAADGGANAFQRSGVVPDVIIGDLDSLSSASRRTFSSSTIIRVTRQDNTDLEKALDYCLDEGANEVVILGAAGKRIDHTLGNLSALWKYTKKVKISLQAGEWSGFLVEQSLHCRAPRGTTVSLIPYSRCEGITLRGLKYALRNARMNTGEVGVSNVVTGSSFSVTIKKGRMLVLVLKKVR